MPELHDIDALIAWTLVPEIGTVEFFQRALLTMVVAQHPNPYPLIIQ